MCYSVEVQFITGITIILSCILFYIFFRNKYSKLSKSKKQWIMPFLTNIIIAFLCIGMHQFFEFLSLITLNQIIYKIGWIFSILAPYFGIMALEKMTNKKFHSWIFLVLILLGSIAYIFIPMKFEAYSFYLRHYTIYIWGAMWTIFLIYIHLCAFDSRRFIRDKDSKKIIIYFLISFVDVSLLLSLIYALYGYFYLGVNICTDLASIWCTFAVIQALFIPGFLTILPKIFKRPNKKRFLDYKTSILFFVISLIVLILFVSFNNSVLHCTI